MGDEYILETHGLSKEFRGFVAVNDVSLRVKRGSIHALIGPNGAGKTTVFNLITRFLPPSGGRIFFNGIDITRERPAQTARRGVIRSFQISAVFPHLTVLENVRIGLQRSLGTSFHFWKSEKTLSVLNDRAMELLDGGGPCVLRKRDHGGAPLRAQAGPGNRHHAGDGPGTDAPGRTDARHGA